VPVQGGIYSEKSSYKIIEHLLASGAYGAGQSSWGPAVYGLTSKEESDSIAERMRIFLEKQEIKGRVIVASGSNKGAEVEVLDAEPANFGQDVLEKSVSSSSKTRFSIV